MLKRQPNRLVGYLFALGATAIWSGNFIIARGLHESISPISLAFWRWVVAIIVFLPFAFKTLIGEWDVLQKHIPYLAVTSFLGITTFNTLIYIAGQTTTAINLSLISITFPVFIVILQRIFYGEAITVRKAVGILFVVLGVVLLITRGEVAELFRLTFAVGDLWMLMAAIIFAFYTILLKRKPKPLSIRAFQLSTFILGTLFLFPFFLWEQVTVQPVPFDPETFAAVLYLGIFAALVAFIFWNQAILMVGPSKAGMIYYALPLFSALLACFFLGEAVGMIHFTSAVCIVAGIVIANYSTSKN